VPLDLAAQKEDVQDALEIIRRRLKPGRLLLTPTAFQELVFLSESADSESERDQASRALRSLTEWGLEVVNLVPVGHGIVEQVADRLHGSGLLPPEEYNDGLILAESALLACAILLTSDRLCPTWISASRLGIKAIRPRNARDCDTARDSCQIHLGFR
jgi:hypothetical protein